MKMTNKQFITELCKILGNDAFLMRDLYDQDELFKMQDDVAKLLAEQATEGLAIARHMTDQFPKCFKTETI